jgi:hypothetical protein
VGEWGTGSFDNGAASDWFYVVEEAVDPGLVIVSALRAVDDLVARLRRSGTDVPASLRP